MQFQVCFLCFKALLGVIFLISQRFTVEKNDFNKGHSIENSEV